MRFLISFLTIAIFCLQSFAHTVTDTTSYKLTVNTVEPIMDNGYTAGIAEFIVDIAPEEKYKLTGNDSIRINVAFDVLTTKLLVNPVIYIKYNNQITYPETIRFSKADWMPNYKNEFNNQFWCNVNSGKNTITVTAISRGAYYNTVKSYMELHQNLNGWIGLNLNYKGRYDAHLVRYEVPESAFVNWAPFVQGEESVAAGYMLGYQPSELMTYGTTHVVSPYGLYSLKANNWASLNEMMFLEQAYIDSVRPLNDNFSFSMRNKVPVSYFIKKLSEVSNIQSTGSKDYAIAGMYNKEFGAKSIDSLGVSSSSLFAAFATNYNLDDFNPVNPLAIKTMAKTYLDPSWKPNAPLALVIFNRNNLSDGTFSEAEIIFTLAKTHRLIVGQAENAAEFLTITNHAYLRNGPFNLVVLAGHGNQFSAACLGIDDTLALEKFKTMLAPNATVVLASCSGAYFYPQFAGQTADNPKHIAAIMQSKLPSAKLIAANDLINKSIINYDSTAVNPFEKYKLFFMGAGADVFRGTSPTNINPSLSNNNVKIIIYPNPANNLLFINGFVENSKISIYDLYGKMLINDKFIENQIDISNLQSGIYITKIETAKGIVTKKFVKQ